MKVLKIGEASSDKDVDELAEKIFNKSLRLLGGLKKLIEYRNLTWLPSIAEASYVLAYKEKSFLTNREIAERLGIAEQTVANILRAKVEEIDEFLRGEKEKIEGHNAGAIAKKALELIKKGI